MEFTTEVRVAGVTPRQLSAALGAPERWPLARFGLTAVRPAGPQARELHFLAMPAPVREVLHSRDSQHMDATYTTRDVVCHRHHTFEADGPDTVWRIRFVWPVSDARWEASPERLRAMSLETHRLFAAYREQSLRAGHDEYADVPHAVYVSEELLPGVTPRELYETMAHPERWPLVSMGLSSIEPLGPDQWRLHYLGIPFEIVETHLYGDESSYEAVFETSTLSCARSHWFDATADGSRWAVEHRWTLVSPRISEDTDLARLSADTHHILATCLRERTSASECC